MNYTKDMNGDGFCGALYYNRGHVTLKRSFWGKVLAFILAVELLLILFLVLGNIFYVNQAQNVLDALIAGTK